MNGHLALRATRVHDRAAAGGEVAGELTSARPMSYSPTRIEGRAAIAEFLATVYRSLPLQYTEYRTIAVHQVSDATLVVEQEALGVNTRTAARFALPNVAVIDVDPDGLITSFRDYANPVAVAEALGDAAR